ncbi:MAG: hypothetical protein PW845_25470 [Pseudomonas sp.]|nr:hypothetical protein [Pseudomonas sp.]
MLAIRQGRVVGVLFSAEKAEAQVPPVVAMLKVFPGNDDAYAYGPVCIDASMSGQGVLGILFDALDEVMLHRQGILFIKQSNGPSLGAHRKLKMQTVAHFELGGEGYDVLTTDAARTRARTSS